MLHLGMETGSRTTATNTTATTNATATTSTTSTTTDTNTTAKAATGPHTAGPHTTGPHTTGPAAAPGGGPCDLVTVPARQGLEAVDILRRGVDREPVGPVLHDGACDTLGFLVPSGTADAWDVPGSACTRTDGRGLRVPAEQPGFGGWLLPPAEDAPVTDPAALRAALDQAARLIEAADNCC